MIKRNIEKAPENSYEQLPEQAPSVLPPAPEVAKTTERRDVLRESTEKQEQLQFQDTGQKMGKGLKQAPNVPASTPPLTPTEKHTFLDTVKEKASDIKKDFMESGPWTKAGYITGGVVGFLAARWLWRTLVGDAQGQKEGLLKKGFKWLLGLGAAAAGILGVKTALDWWRGKTTIPTEIPKAGTDAITGAVNELMTTGKKLAEVGGKDVRFWIDLLSQDRFADAGQFFIQEGMPLAWENGKLAVHIGTRAVVLPVRSATKFAEWIAAGKKDEDFSIIYGESGVAYFLGQKAFNLFVRGELKTLIPLTKKDALFSVIKIASGPLGAGRDVASVTWTARTRQGREALWLRYGKQSVPGKVLSAANNFRTNLQTSEGLLQGMEQWKALQRDVEIMEQFSTGGFRMFSETELLSKIHARQKLADDIRLAAQQMTLPADAPDVLKQIAAKSQLGITEFEKAMDNARTASNANNVTHETEPARQAAVADEGGPARKLDLAPDEKPQLRVVHAENIDELPLELKAIVKQADEAMELPHGPVRAAAIEEVLESPALARAATAAPESNAAALQKAGTLAKNSKLLATGMIGIGVLVDMYFIADNWKQIAAAEKDGDEAKAAILRARAETLIKGGIGGVTVGGMGMAGSSFAGPLGLALMGGTITSEMLYSYAQKLNTNDAAYMKRDPADLLKELRDLPFPSWSEEIAGTIAGNKEDVKKNKWLSLCRAYLMKTNASVVQHTEADRKEADRLFHEEASPQKKTELLAQHGSEGAAINALLQEVAYNRLVLLMRKQMEFLRTRSNVPGARDFREAESFAKMYELRRSFEDAGRAPVIITYPAREGKTETLNLSTLPALNALPDSGDRAAWDQINQTVKQYERYDIARTRSEFLALTNHVDGNAASNFLQVKLLQRMQHTIIVSEAKVQKAFAAPLDMDVSGGLFDFQANVVRYELRKKIMMNINAMATHIMNTSTNLDIVMEKFANYENTLNTLDMKTVFDEAKGGHDNPLKHALASDTQLTIGQVYQIELQEGSGSTARMRKEAAIAGQKAIEKEIGVPLEQALTSLLAPRVS